MSNTVHLTDDNFYEEVLESKLPVLVDFWADWCGPCRRVAPTIEEIAERYAGQLKVGKLNVDESPRVASDHGINSIPTLMFFRGGNPVEEVIGVVPKEELVDVISRVLDNRLSA